ncbi:MAG: NAD(P)/FAD-dependent oxidoreductase [Pyrinomonadaceae bacterium]
MLESNRTFDVVIIGGGPAGIAAAIWCGDLGLTSALIDRNEVLGGQLLNVFNPITNYPGISAASGSDLRDLFVNSLSRQNCRQLLGLDVVGFDSEKMSVLLSDGSVYFGNSIIIATGVRRRRLGVPGEKEFLGKGILYSGAKEAQSVKGRNVLVVGGGDAATENALILSEFARSVILVHRGEKLSARRDFVERIHKTANVNVLFNSEVLNFEGDNKLLSVNIADRKTNTSQTIEIDNALVRIGFEPNSELFRFQINCDQNGYILIDSNCRTTSPNTYAAGDVALPNTQTIAAAAGMGSTAAKSAAFLINNFKDV